jgi:phosphoglycerol transferase MdoB-like AlkP superfamily enzyme/glycerophosphoryl diester phosphodiesterase
MIINRKFILLSLLFASLVSVGRFYILFAYSDNVSIDYILALSIGVINSFTVGLLVSSGVMFIKRNILFHIYILVVGIFILFEFACFHYEAVFGRLPGVDILYYFTEIIHLSSSLKSNIPALSLITETLVVLVLFYAVSLRFRSDDSYFLPLGNFYKLLVYFVAALSLLVQAYPVLVPEKWFWGSREPLLWMFKSNFVKESYKLDEMVLSEKDFQQFLQYHGHDPAQALIDPAFPLCRIANYENDISLKRNIILLILEGVGNNELWKVFNEQALMPNLQMIAQENLLFKNIYAPGTKSVQALPAIFSGLPPNPHQNYLWKTPLIHFNGFPEILRSMDYETVYFHGSDLSFEKQRQYLKEIGFDEINEYDSSEQHKVNGWGYDDGVMFRQLRSWIEKQNINKPEIPYLSSLFTLSTHDPYVLPPDWEPKYSKMVRTLSDSSNWRNIEGERNTVTAMAESYAFLDHHLGKFYKWFKKNENNTLLLITGDHAPHIVNEVQGMETKELRFGVPLIIAGLTEIEKEKYSSYTSRLGGLHDIPATLMNLVGQAGESCDLGLNLLMPDDEWPDKRYIYSVGGDVLENIHVRNKSETFVLDRLRSDIRRLGDETESDSSSANNIFDNVKALFNNILPIHYYLLSTNNYMLHKKHKAGTVLPKVETPIFVSHRGNISGPGTTSSENRPHLLDETVKSKFKWMEVDVQVTSDSVPILMHDNYIEVSGEKKSIHSVTLRELHSIEEYKDVITLEDAVERYSPHINMLVEIKPVPHISYILHLGREVSRIIRERKGDGEIIVDSFNETIASSIKNQCECEVGIDAPYMKKPGEEDFLDYQKAGFNWVYLHFSVIDKELIQKAHNYGLKVMAYTVNSSDIINEWYETELPDGVITDDMGIIQ